MARAKVVVTGLGLRVPGARSLDELAALYRSGRAATRPLTGALSAWSGGIVDGEDHDPERIDRASALALAAAGDAVAVSGLDAGALSSAGVFVGAGAAGMLTLEASLNALVADNTMRSNTLPRSMANAPAAHISITHGCGGPILTYAMACSSSAHAIGEAFHAIAGGRCVTAIAGGTEAAMSYGVHRSWAALRLLAQGEGAACRPFCYERAGLVLGEGAVFFVLEDAAAAEARGAQALVEIAGYGACGDASHITAPSRDGQARTMAMALRSAGLQPRDIGHISAHGTATLAGDLSETQAIRSVFGELAPGIPVTATKSIHGHLLGAAGAVGLLAGLLAVRDGLIAPTVNFGSPDPDLGLDYVPNAAREGARVDYALANAFGFGGSNACLILSRI